MTRLIRRVLWLIAGAIAIGVALVIALVVILRPPTTSVPARGVRLSHVTIVNPGSGRRSEQTITVDGDQVRSIKDSSPGDDADGPATRWAGMYVLPGLIDMHVHHPPGFAVADTRLFALLYLGHGVTTVRDTGNFDGTIWRTRDEIRDGLYPGPRIFACGPILDGEPPIWPNSLVVRTAAEAPAAVDAVAAFGANCVKVYQNLTADALAAILEAARQKNLPVIGHVSSWVPFERAHISDVQHLTGVGLPAPPWIYPNPDFRDFVSRVMAGWRLVDDARIDFIVRTSAEQGISHTPTLVVWEHVARLSDYDAERRSPAAQLVPRYYREVTWRPGGYLLPFAKPASFSATRELMPTLKTVVRRLHQAGVRIHVGSDTPNPFVVPGISVHEELQNLVDAGLPAEDAWLAATRLSGEALRMEKLGTVQEGAPADLVIFRNDPTRDLHALATLEGVVSQGRLYPRAELDAAVRRHHLYMNSRIVDALTMFLTRLTVRSPG
jgi:imidazolonepropionase-like amidohydrolase